MKIFPVIAALVAIPAVASAHVVLTGTSAPAGAYYAAVFRVGHGCGGSATTAVTVHLPDSIPAPHPQPKAGWTIETTRAPDSQRVVAVTWRGLLPSEEFDDFGLLMKLPDTPGDLVLPVTQTCTDAVSEWNGATPGRPAPILHIGEAPAAAMDHHGH